MLVVTSESPVPLVPDVPTARDQGHNVDLVLWRGLAAPAGTPAEAVEKLEAAVSAVVASERFKQASERIGCLPAVRAGYSRQGWVECQDVPRARQPSIVR